MGVSSGSEGERETAALRQEVETLRAEITKARQTILHMQEREKKRKDRYTSFFLINKISSNPISHQ